MRIAIGNDHRGFALKRKLVPMLQGLGYEVIDEGEQSTESADYPDSAGRVASRVSSGDCELGILACGSGIGMAITANKFPHVRATIVFDEKMAEMCRRHNNVNVLCLGEAQEAGGLAERMVKTWLDTPFDGGRHARRLEKIAAIESGRTC
jgi:ribose 5-phosphate isomerase B